ncbi:MAG: alpha-amylase family glycosyl hydrolase [Candidatus Cryptobacteroides sp.]
MIIYQVLPRLYSKGRFSSFNKKTFDYLKSLSVSHIWFTGVIRHSMNAPYVKGNIGSPFSISDYYDVNPYLADNPDKRLAEFKAMVTRIHNAGLKVLLDFIPNHVSPDYHDAHGGLKTLGRCDYDWTDTDKIDYGCRENWQKMLDILRFWASMGVDGFRCDMVELVPLDFWQYLISTAKSEFPELLFIAEVYDMNKYSLFSYNANFDLLYDKSGLYDTLRAITCAGASARNITTNWQRLGPLQSKMLNFLENHDEQRIASKRFARHPQRAYSALGISALFYPTAFMLYFGQELGEAAADGVEGRTSIFDAARAINPLCKLDEEQKSVLEKYRETLALKEELGEAANYDLCYCQSPENGFDPNHHFAFLRGDSTLVVCNFNRSDAEMTISIPASAGSRLPDRVKVQIKANDFTIYRK